MIWKGLKGVMQFMASKNNSSLFYVCSLIEYKLEEKRNRKEKERSCKEARKK